MFSCGLWHTGQVRHTVMGRKLLLPVDFQVVELTWSHLPRCLLACMEMSECGCIWSFTAEGIKWSV